MRLPLTACEVPCVRFPRVVRQASPAATTACPSFGQHSVLGGWLGLSIQSFRSEPCHVCSMPSLRDFHPQSRRPLLGAPHLTFLQSLPMRCRCPFTRKRRRTAALQNAIARTKASERPSGFGVRRFCAAFVERATLRERCLKKLVIILTRPATNQIQGLVIECDAARRSRLFEAD